MTAAESQENGIVAEGRYLAQSEEPLAKNTRKGRLSFLPCRITQAGKHEGRVVDFLVPRSIDPRLLANQACRIEVKHVTRGGYVYANVAALAAL